MRTRERLINPQFHPQPTIVHNVALIPNYFESGEEDNGRQSREFPYRPSQNEPMNAYGYPGYQQQKYYDNYMYDPYDYVDYGEEMEVVPPPHRPPKSSKRREKQQKSSDSDDSSSSSSDVKRKKMLKKSQKLV